MEKLAAFYEGKVKFCKLNIVENHCLAIELKVMGLPTFLFYNNGELLSRITGDEETIASITEHANGLL